MKSQPFYSLQHIIFRILVSNHIIFGLVIVFVMLGSSYLNWQNHIEQQNQSNILLAQRISEYFDSASRVLHALAAMPSAQSTLDAIQKTYETFDVVYLIDAQGRLAKISPQDRQIPIGMDMTAQPYFQTGLKNIAISDMFISPRTGNPTVYLSVPSTMDSELVVGELNLIEMQQSLATPALYQLGFVYVIETSGDLLAYPDYNLVRQQENIRQLGINEQILLGESQLLYWVNGELVLASVSPIPQTPWLAITQVPVMVVLAPFLLPTGIGLLLTLVLFLSIIWREKKVLTQQVIAPLNQIRYQAQVLAEGQYHQEQSLASQTLAYSEVHSLAVSFEQMKEAISSRESALRESEERFRYAMEATSDGLWDWDTRTGKVSYSSNYMKILGYEPDEFPMIVQSWQNLIHPEDYEAVLKINNDCVENRVQIFEIEYRMLTKSGDWKWILSRAKAVTRDSEGQALRLIGTHIDITERKRSEAAIRQLADKLEQRVIERTASLESANKELEAFSYSVSHDLRAPLRGIDGWSLVLLEDYSEQLDDQAHQYLHRIRTEAQRMGRLIDALLNLSRASLNEMEKRTVNLSELAQIIATNLQNTLPERQIEWKIQSNMQVEGDGTLIEIVIDNLFRNAIKFTEKCPIAQIEFGQISLNGQSTFFVRDNGAGFDMTYAQNLFGPFQRLHKTSEYPGTGIGLAIVKRIIGRHQGKIWAEAQPDQGAVFYFTMELIK
jgi:PAS domain S-box-containing protein